jgi:hypothetical protein
MRHIYKAAKRTVVYLGDEADDSAFAAVFLTWLVERLRISMAAELEKGIDKKDKLQDIGRQLGSTREELFKFLPPRNTTSHSISVGEALVPTGMGNPRIRRLQRDSDACGNGRNRMEVFRVGIWLRLPCSSGDLA